MSRNIKIVDGAISTERHENKFEFNKKIKSQIMLEDGQSYKVILTPPSIEYVVDSQAFQVIKYINKDNLSMLFQNYFQDWHLQAL